MIKEIVNIGDGERVDRLKSDVWIGLEAAHQSPPLDRMNLDKSYTVM